MEQVVLDRGRGAGAQTLLRVTYHRGNAQYFRSVDEVRAYLEPRGVWEHLQVVDSGD